MRDEAIAREVLEVLQGIVPAEAPGQAATTCHLEGELLVARRHEAPRGGDVDPERVTSLQADLLQPVLDGGMGRLGLLLEVLGQEDQEVGGVVGEPGPPLAGDPSLRAAVVADHVVGDRLDGQELAGSERREGALQEGLDDIICRLAVGGEARGGCGHGEPPTSDRKRAGSLSQDAWLLASPKRPRLFGRGGLAKDRLCPHSLGSIEQGRSIDSRWGMVTCNGSETTLAS
ncbi:hypothetical protein D3C87_1518660 [compost metagenome]